MKEYSKGLYTLEYDKAGDGAVVTGFRGSGYECFVPDTLPFDDIEYPVTAIGKKAFLDSPFKSVSLPPSVTEIGDWAFSKSQHLTRLTVREGVKDLERMTLGKGILEGTSSLEHVMLGYEKEDDLSALLALSVNTLPAPFLLRTRELGTKGWYESFDSALLGYLNESDESGYRAEILCGEEDISYDDLGSLDGEMPGRPLAYVRKKREEKAALCLIRILKDTFLSEEKRDSFTGYIKEHALGTKDPSAWEALKHRFASDLSYVQVYCDIIKPDISMRDEMLKDMGKSGPEVKAFLLQKEGRASDDFFDSLKL